MNSHNNTDLFTWFCGKDLSNCTPTCRQSIDHGPHRIARADFKDITNNKKSRVSGHLPLDSWYFFCNCFFLRMGYGILIMQIQLVDKFFFL